MTRTFVVALLASTLGALGSYLALGGPAQAEGSRVECTQVPSRPGQTDEQFIANFMSEQLAIGHNHFTTVPGVSTVLCGW
jgi:hypothetical protein